MTSLEGASDTPESQDKKVVAVPEVTLEGGTVHFHDQAGVVSGNVHRGGVIRGESDLTVEGDVLGSAESTCVIEMGGHVHFEQSVAGAKIRGYSIVVMGDVSVCQLQSDTHIEIHGNFSSGEVALGARTEDIRRLNTLRIEENAAESHLRELKVQTSLAARKFIRDYPQVELKMGNILVPQRRELRVDLQQFYNAVDVDDQDKVDRALDEFYLRVVVGMLTRNNKDYISRNPSRHKIFLKLIEDLRKHLLKIREMDKLEDRVRVVRRESYALLEDLKNPDEPPKFRVGGCVGPGVAMHFVRLRGFSERSNGTVDIDREIIEARLISRESELFLESISPDGEKKVVQMPGEMANGSFGTSGDAVIWRPVT